MFRALFRCAESECAEVFEAYGPLEELEALACDCGCTLELLEIAEVDEPVPPGRFVLLPLS
jgi:hypothetical protein